MAAGDRPMTTLTAPPDVRAVAAPTRTAAQLRLRRAGREERLLEATPGKCAIGSSPRCQVCLPAGEAQPLQCLLQVTASGATVTRWAAGVLLNGHEFSQQALKDGDCLSIGPWELVWETGADATAVAEQGSRETIDFVPRTGFAPLPKEAERQSPTAPSPTPAARLTAEPPSTRSAAPLADAPPPAHPTMPRCTTTLAPPKPPNAPASLTPAHPVEPPQPRPTRPAAKTMLVASRKTDAFPDLLGPARPASSPAPSPGSKTTLIRAALTRQLFEDRLVVSLWTSNFQARRRARALVAAARNARQQVAEISMALAATQQQLDALRADRDANAARAEQLSSQLASLRDELTRAVQQRDRVAEELEALRSAPTKTAPPDPRLQMLTDACGAAKREAAELGQQLAAAESQLVELRRRCQDAEAACDATEKRAAEQEEALAASKRQASEQAAALAQVEQRVSDQAAALALAEQQAAERATALAGVQSRLAELQTKSDHAQAERDAWQRDQLAAQHAQAASQEQLEALRAELAAAEAAIEPLREQANEAEAARAAAADELAIVQRQQQQWLAECRILQANHAEQLANLADERDQLRRQLDELAAAPAAAMAPHETHSAAWTGSDQGPPSDEDAPSATSANLAYPTGESVAWPEIAEDEAEAPVSRSAAADELEVSPALSPGPSPGDDPAPGPIDSEVESSWNADAPAPAESDVARESSAATKAPTAFGEAAERVAPPQPGGTAAVIHTPSTTPATGSAPVDPSAASSPYSAPSFIDKYRHLLEDDGGEPAPDLVAKRPNRLLDDEFLSPAQSTPVSASDEESDEALEAYMSNLMRRVRGDGPSSASIPVAETFETTLEPEVHDAPPSEPEIKLDENGLLRLVRKQPMTTNLSALREIANTSARTAIAQHRQRRRVESAVSKSLVCVTASAASAYLMLTAPQMQSPWFWGGCVTLVLAVGSGAQMAVIFWQRFADRRRQSQGDASMSFGADQAVDGSSGEPAASVY